MAKPALPALWRAWAWERGTTCRHSAPAAPLYNRAFTNPESTTYRTPGTVTDVSEMLVVQITCTHHTACLALEILVTWSWNMLPKDQQMLMLTRAQDLIQFDLSLTKTRLGF